ncbi:MAG: hypothetical protein ACLTMP_08845 [Eggerthella lenta]
MASVKGAKVSDMLSMTDIARGEHYHVQGQGRLRLPSPRRNAEKEALLVYQIDEQKLSEGERLQVWMPTPWLAFTRAVTDIELSVSDEVPEVQGPDDEYRAKVNILSTVDGGFKVATWSPSRLRDDCGAGRLPVEFSMDGGETYLFDTSSSNAEDWVYWHSTTWPRRRAPSSSTSARSRRTARSPCLQRGVRR